MNLLEKPGQNKESVEKKSDGELKKISRWWKEVPKHSVLVAENLKVERECDAIAEHFEFRDAKS